MLIKCFTYNYDVSLFFLSVFLHIFTDAKLQERDSEKYPQKGVLPGGRIILTL